MQRLKDLIEVNSRLQSRETIADYLDNKAIKLQTLVMFGEYDGALVELDLLMQEIAEQPSWWRNVMTTMRIDHQEMSKVINQLSTAGLERHLAVVEIMNRDR